MPDSEKTPIEIDAEFDRLLQSALSSYADPGSDGALAKRVLARVAAEPSRKSTFRWLPWAIAVPVAAGLLIFILFGSRPLHRTGEHSEQARVSQPPSAISGSEPRSITPKQQYQIARVKTHPRSSQMVPKIAPPPKLQIFPTPQPLTPAERALVDYAAHAPQGDRQVLIETQRKMDEPLSIAAIEIQPLEPPEGGGN